MNNNTSGINYKLNGRSITRRDLFKIAGSGLIVFFTADYLFSQQRQRSQPGGDAPPDFNAYLKISADGRVSLYTGKIEMGQGVVTSLAGMLADELGVSIDKIDMIMGDTDLCPWDRGTFGSMSTRFFGPMLRQAGAEARSVLLILAAERLNVPPERLTVRNGIISDKSNAGKKISYAELTRGRIIERHLDAKPPEKKINEFQVMGKSFNRRDTDKVNGKTLYAADVYLPGMLYAKILRPPAHGAKLKNIDDSAIKNISGIQIVKEKDFFAVLHQYPDVAEKAMSQVKAEFEIPGGNPDSTNIYEHLLNAAPKEGGIISEGGNLKEGENLSLRTFEKIYYDSYVAHAALETHAATAKVENGRVIVWASTQTPFPARESVAAALGIPAKNVRVIASYLGGGFGGKSFHLQAVEAARLAKFTGKPVQVMWSRKEEFFNDTFRPASIIKIKSGLSDKGRISFWQYDVYYAGPRGAEIFYNIPHHRETSYVNYNGTSGSHPFATGPWRAPGNSSNTFARESHIDLMAAHLKADPLEFRINNLTDKRMIKTLETAASGFGWTGYTKKPGQGFGIACSRDAGTCTATIAEVQVNMDSGKVAVRRIVHGQDMGFVINPEGAILQMEGALTMGLGYALSEEIKFKGGQILQENFDSYEIPRFSWLPEIETVLVDNPSHPPQGGGEPAITCVGAAIGNAIFNAAGIRLFRMPMTPVRVKEAIKMAQKT